MRFLDADMDPVTLECCPRCNGSLVFTRYHAMTNCFCICCGWQEMLWND